MHATVRDELPYDVTVDPHVPVSLPDGTVLSARIWHPAGAGKVPAVLEAIPYRKDDVTLVDDAVRHTYVAGHGYVCVRLDLRGSGDSQGVLTDEYSAQETDDLVHVVAWLARQPWCDGSVGMVGISWSGFNALQVAARRPDALRAVITVCSSDDRYDNDVHYMGGVVLAFYLVVWAAVMHTFNARPPDPQIVGAEWESMWRERLAANPDLARLWLEHQRRDDYWKRGSVCEDYPAIRCPVLAVGGWADAYTDTVWRLLQSLPGFTRGILGPWGHTWPERGVPGPATGFLQECVRWWDRWLKGIATGVEKDPKLRYWRQDTVPPRPDLGTRPGTWLGCDAPGAGSALILPLGDLTVRGERVPTVMEHRSPLTVGQCAGSWLPYGNPTDLPGDQAPDDALSLVLDSEPLSESLDVLGRPELSLRVRADQPEALVFVRLCAVDPDGRSAVITRGALNLTHHAGHAVPRALVPGEDIDAVVTLKAVGQRVPRGSRLRLAISTSYWPWLWPSPRMTTIAVTTTVGRLVVPVASPDDRAVGFGPPEHARPPQVEDLRQRLPVVSSHEQDGWTVFDLRRDLNGTVRYPSGLVYDDEDPIEFRIREGDPLSAQVSLRRTTRIGRGDWQTRLETRALMTSTATTFDTELELVAFHGDREVHRRTHVASVPRDHG